MAMNRVLLTMHKVIKSSMKGSNTTRATSSWTRIQHQKQSQTQSISRHLRQPICKLSLNVLFSESLDDDEDVEDDEIEEESDDENDDDEDDIVDDDDGDVDLDVGHPSKPSTPSKSS